MNHTLEVLGAVEGLLLLEQPNIAGDWDATNVLAVRTVLRSVHILHSPKKRLRIREWDALVVGEVRSIVLTLATLNRSRDLRNDVGGPFVAASHVAYAWVSHLNANILSQCMSHMLFIDGRYAPRP
jgi:hypothetical protein